MSTSRSTNAEQELISAFTSNDSEILQMMLKEYFSTVPPNKEETLNKLTEHLEQTPIMINGKPLKAEHVKMLGGTNNVNFIIETDDASIVLQLGMRLPVTDTAVKSLRSKNSQPIWLAKKHGEAILTDESEFVTRESPPEHSLNNFPSKYEGYVAIVEKCPKTLHSRLTEIHSTSIESKNEDVLRLTQNIGSQLFGMLDEISSRNILWTDMKPGNILLRDNDEVAIADTKAFNKSETMLYRRQKGANVINYSSAVTEGYLSQDFRIKRIEMACERNDLKQIWQKEYSYQMAMMLYYLATNTEVISPRWPDEIYPPLNFDLPVFKTEVGQRLQSIIERLAHDDPIVRMNCKDAAKLLSLINNKKEFDAENKKVKQVITAQYGQSLLNRTFDPARVQTNEENKGKPYYESVEISLGKKAQQISLSDIDKIDLDNFSEQTIINLREKFSDIIKDIEDTIPTGLSPEEATALKAGYIYYVYSQAIKTEDKKYRDETFKTSDNDEMNRLIDKSAKLKLQGELIRLICADMSKPVKDSLETIKKVNAENISEIIRSYTTEGTRSTRPDYIPNFKSYDSASLRLGYHLGNFGVKPHEKDSLSESNKFENGQDDVEVYVKSRILTFSEIADTTIENAIGKRSKKDREENKKLDNTKKVLAESWGKVAARIQQDINSNELLHKFTAMEDTYVRSNKDKLEFEQLCNLTKDVLNIEKSYRKRMFGLMEKYGNKASESQQQKEVIVNLIHKKLDFLLKDYPDKKSLNQIKKEMHDYLNKQIIELNNQGHTKTLLHELIMDTAEKIKPPIEKPTPGPGWYLNHIKTDREKLGAAILNRPFDASGYKKLYEGRLDPGVQPSDILFGANAKSLTHAEITKLIDIDNFSPDTILNIRNKFNAILQDLDAAMPSGLTVEQQKAIKSGYLFNSFMIALRPLIDKAVLASTAATKTNSPNAKELSDAVAKLTLQSELIRLISDDLDKSPEECFNNIRKINSEKVEKLFSKCILDRLTVEGYQLDSGYKPNDIATIKFAYPLGNLGVDPNNKDLPVPSQKFKNSNEASDYIKSRIIHFTSVMTPTLTDAATIKTKSHPSGMLLNNIRDALAGSWTRSASAIQMEVNKNSSFHTSPKLEEDFITTNKQVDDFIKLCRFTKNILCIERNYLDRWHGIDKIFNETEKANQVIKDKVVAQINNKLYEFIQQHPAKKADDIRREMIMFLLKQIEFLDKNLPSEPPLRDYIRRTADKITTLLKKEAEQTRQAMEKVLGMDQKKEPLKSIEVGEVKIEVVSEKKGMMDVENEQGRRI